MTGVPDEIDALRGAVREDPELHPLEKETVIRFAKDQELAHVFSGESGITGRLLAHPLAEDVRVTVADGTARPSRTLEEWDGETVYGIQAKLPVATLLIKGTPRKSNQHAPVVAKSVIKGTTEGEP